MAEMPKTDESGAVSPRADELSRIDRNRRLAFLDLDAADAEVLRSVKSLFEAQADQFVDRFYDHLRSFSETAPFLNNPDRVERLKRLQREHLESMLEAHWDDDYVRRRWRVGHAHADVGVEPLFFLGGYIQYVQYCFQVFTAAKNQPVQGYDWALALLKAIFLDVGLTLDAYFDQSTRSLQHALDMLWKANEELRRFAQLTTHDLKTPLATVANLCDEAIDEFGADMPADARDLIVAARQATFRMSTMIDELLAAALSAQSIEAEGIVSSESAVQEAVERVRPVLRKKGITLTVAPSLPQVWGNHARLREAVFNLLSNAAKFVDPQEGKIDVTVDVQDDTCVIGICDNGPGIPAEERERIFVPFRRLPAHRDQPGSGLGLYFTKSLIEQQGGSVWVESEPGRGSRFYLLLRRFGAAETE